MYTRDGKDGFPSELDFQGILVDYMEGLNPRKREKALMSQTMYDEILSILAEPNNTRDSTAQFRFWAKKMFRLVVTAHAQVVTHENRPVAVREQIYDVLVQCHAQCSHGGRDKTSNQVRRFYSWIPKELIARFVKACPFCTTRRLARATTTGQFSYLDEGSSPSDNGSGSNGDSKPPSTRTTPQRVNKATAASAAALAHRIALATSSGAFPSDSTASLRNMPEVSITCPPMPAPSANPFDWSSFGQPNLGQFHMMANPNVPQIPQPNIVYPHMQPLPPHMLSRPASVASNHSDGEQDLFAHGLSPAFTQEMVNPIIEQPSFDGRSAELVDGWYGSAEGRQAAIMMHRSTSGMSTFSSASEYSQQSAVDQSLSQLVAGRLLPPGFARSPPRHLSFDNSLTIDTTHRPERPGSSCSISSNHPLTPITPVTPLTPNEPRATSRSPAPLDVDPQDLEESVQEYFNQYGDGMDLISQAASLEGLAGVALMKNVVEATSTDFSKVTTQKARMTSSSKEAARAEADVRQQSPSGVTITIEEHQSQHLPHQQPILSPEQNASLYAQQSHYLTYNAGLVDDAADQSFGSDFSFEHIGIQDYMNSAHITSHIASAAGQYIPASISPHHLHDLVSPRSIEHSPVATTEA